MWGGGIVGRAFAGRPLESSPTRRTPMTQDPYHNPTPPRDAPYPGPPASGPVAAAEDLQFDRAESAAAPSPGAVAGFGPPAPGAATTCAVCHRPIADYYFEAAGKVLCPNCQQ